MDEPIRVLCVDDEPNLLRALERIFLDEDYEILTALSGKEGLEILSKVKPIQIVISDYRMPGMNGVDFLQKVFKEWPETIRIVLSGYADTAAIVGAINEGNIYKFIPKPWNDDVLKVTITTALERFFHHKENLQLMERVKHKEEELKTLRENVEELVEQRTADLKLQNRKLILSQNILEALPFAVVGLDPAGVVVHCNRKGETLFNGKEEGLLATNRKSSLPNEINAFIEEVMKKETLSRRMTIAGEKMEVSGLLVKQADDQNNIILILDKESAHD